MSSERLVFPPSFEAVGEKRREEKKRKEKKRKEKKRNEKKRKEKKRKEKKRKKKEKKTRQEKRKDKTRRKSTENILKSPKNWVARRVPFLIASQTTFLSSDPFQMPVIVYAFSIFLKEYMGSRELDGK